MAFSCVDLPVPMSDTINTRLDYRVNLTCALFWTSVVVLNVVVCTLS